MSAAVLTRSRASGEQLELLVSFMEEHPEFAASKQSVYSRFSASKLWRLLAERLNAAAPDSGGARKSPDKWCRFWADVKYKVRKKTAAGGTLGDLSSVEERIRNILNSGTRYSVTSGGGGGQSDEERKPGLEEDGGSESSGGGAGAGGGDAPRLATEELLAEAAMRTALAAEKQAEAVSQGVELLRELLDLMRQSVAPHAHSAVGHSMHHHQL